MRKVLVFIFVAMSVMGVAQGVPGVTEDKILIGSFQALSGPVAPIGLDMTRGMQTYFRWINDLGGVWGRKIELLVENDQFNPALTVALVKKLVESDGVFAIVGGLGTPGCLAVMDYLNSNGVPFVYQGSGSSKLAFPPKEWVFAVQPNYTVEGQIIAKYAVEELGAKRIAVIYQNDDIGNEGLNGVKMYLEKVGLKPVAEVAFTPGQVGFSAEVLKLMAANPDVVVIYAILAPTVGILAESQAAGLKTQFITSYINADLSLVQLAGAAAEGLLVTGWVPVLDLTDYDMFLYYSVFRYYNPDYPGIPSGYVAAGWIAAEVFTGALLKAGPQLTRESLKTALESMHNWDGLLAKGITYGPNERAGKISMYFFRIQGGAFVPVTGWISVP
jgi:branched-chain amino acid transport system substrate-binding protein